MAKGPPLCQDCSDGRFSAGLWEPIAPNHKFWHNRVVAMTGRTLADEIRLLIGAYAPASNAEAGAALRGLPGRGPDGYADRLQNMLNANRVRFLEPIEVQVTDHPQDHGVDLVVSRTVTVERVGFQIKSDNDLKDAEFTKNLKAQITDALAWNVSLLVIVFACEPTEKNKLKYLYACDHLSTTEPIRLMTVLPDKATGLLKAQPRPPSSAADRWAEFFLAAGQSDRGQQSLDRWTALTPRQRFIPPKEHERIRESMDLSPLTLVVGPPAVGKTFVVLQILYDMFCKGRRVQWIGPEIMNDVQSPVLLADRSHLEMAARIDRLARSLGLQPNVPPQDAYDFIVCHVKKDSTIYIEDPFGRTDEEFESSLSTYRFFDLNAFVEAVGKSPPRSGCRFVITSREGLFERWLEEKRCSGQAIASAKIIPLNSASYKRSDVHQLLLRLITRQRCQDPTAVADVLLPQVELPFEAEMLAKDVDETTDVLSAQDLASRNRGDNAARARARTTPENDEGRLFLFLVTALSTGGFGREDFPRAFETLFSALGLVGLAKDALAKTLRKFRSLVTRLDPPADVPALLADLTAKGYHLEAVHSTVLEGIRHEMAGNSLSFCIRLALHLDHIPGRENLDNDTSHWLQKTIAIALLGTGAAGDQDAREALTRVLFADKDLSFVHLGRLLDQWNLLPPSMKEVAFDWMTRTTALTLAQIAGCLSRRKSIFSPEEAWRVYENLLACGGTLGATRHDMFSGGAWEFAIENIEKMPGKIREKLDSLASLQPVLFSVGIGPSLLHHWERVPANW